MDKKVKEVAIALLKTKLHRGIPLPGRGNEGEVNPRRIAAGLLLVSLAGFAFVEVIILIAGGVQ